MHRLVCIGFEAGPHSKTEYFADFYSKFAERMGFRSAPIGTLQSFDFHF
jgi:hypothetical protein